MQYRYSRGQTGQGSQPRPASSQDEVILQLESELLELRNACAWKDQRIAELSRGDAPAGRLRRDVRLLAAELHRARRQLSESLGERQELQQQRGRGEAVAGAGAAVDSSPSAGACASRGGAERGSERSLRESIGQLQEENRQLKDTVARLQTPPLPDGGLHRASEPAQPHLPGLGGGYRSSDPGPLLPRAGHLLGQAGAGGPAAGPPAAGVPQEEQFFQIVYSTVRTELTATTGPRTLQGVGTLDGAASIAKVLLSRIGSSVCSGHRRPAGAPGAPVAGQPLQPGQMPMVMVGMPQGA